MRREQKTTQLGTRWQVQVQVAGVGAGQQAALAKQTPTEQLIGCPAGSGRRESGARSLAQSAGTTQVAGDNRDQTLKRESATIIGQKRRRSLQGAKVRTLLYGTLMPRYPGTPVPSWPGTFCLACLQRSVSGIFWQPSGASGDRPGSPHFASPQHKRFRKSDHPTDRPPCCMSELHKLFMSRARGGGMKSSLHCTVPQRWTSSDNNQFFFNFFF